MVKLDYKAHKTCIFGIQGSGKTEFVKHQYRHFKKPIVFALNADDGWEKLPNLYVFKARRMHIKEDFALFIKKCRSWAMAGKIDLIIIDEADMFFQTNWDLDEAFHDIILNHRHMGGGVALWCVTRRPQDIPTKIVETSKHLIIYKLEGANAINRFEEIHPALPEMIGQLVYEEHDFIHKQIGKEPKRMPALKIK